MGDHRASIKIEMKFHGVEDRADMGFYLRLATPASRAR